MKNNNAIIIGAGIAVAGFFGYKYWKKKQDEKKEAEKPKKEPVSEGGGVTSNQPSGYSEYQKKVMKLQSIVGAAIDGNAGPQTNKLVAAFFPISFAKLGNVSVSNIDAYLALNGKREANVADRIDQIWNAMGSGTPATLRTDTQVSAYYYDNSRGQYLPTGGIFVAKQGTKLYKSTTVKTSIGFIVTVPVYFTNTNTVAGSRMILIKPDNLFV